jgi:CBS domain-containing protein
MTQLDDYSEEFDADLREIRGALFDDTVAVLSPREPACIREHVSVQEAVNAMVARHQAGVLVVDETGRVTGIFTERDVLLRVVDRGLDAVRTLVGSVMTRDPQVLERDDRVAHALHCMGVAGYRTLPIVDADKRPIGVITATDIMQWLAGLFPETVLNLAPGDRVKHPEQLDAG